MNDVRTRSIFETAAFGLAYLDVDGRWIDVNQQVLRSTGYVREELIENTLLDLLQPGDAETVRARLSQLWKGTLESYKIETRIRKRGGELVWVDITLSVENDADGAPLVILGVVQEAELRKAAEERQRLLLAELNHRVRNTLATIQSIATQTLRYAENPERFVESLFARVGALASVHDILLQTAWDGADLATLIRAQLGQVGASDIERVRCLGPALVLPPRIALQLSLVLHELAANAVRHGALSNDVGQVDVGWSINGGGAPTLDISWIETGGPPVTAPNRVGLGTLLIDRASSDGLDAKTVLSWKETGLVFEIAMPIPREAARPDLFIP